MPEHDCNNHLVHGVKAGDRIWSCSICGGGSFGFHEIEGDHETEGDHEHFWTRLLPTTRQVYQCTRCGKRRTYPRNLPQNERVTDHASH